MSKELGPREKALREQREAKYDANHKAARPTIKALANAVTVAAKKRGKPRKAKK